MRGRGGGVLVDGCRREGRRVGFGRGGEGVFVRLGCWMRRSRILTGRRGFGMSFRCRQSGCLEVECRCRLIERGLRRWKRWWMPLSIWSGMCTSV